MEKNNHHEPILIRDDVALESEANLGHFSRYLNVILAPKKTFEDVDRAPKVLIPILIVMLLSALLVFINFDAVLQQAQEALIQQTLQQTGEVPADGMLGLAKVSVIIGAGFSGIVPLLALLISSALSRGVATFMDGEGSFKRLLSANLYAFMILFLGRLVIMGLTMGIGLETMSLSLAMFLPESAPQALMILLDAFDVFGVWNLLVMTIAIQAIERLSFVKSLICAILPTVILVLLSMVLN